MKAFVLDSNSWHFKLANFNERRIWSDEETDICEYSRAVMAGALTLIFLIIGAILLAVWIGASLYNIYTFNAEDAKLEVWTFIFISITSGLLFSLGIVAIKVWLENRPVKDGPEEEPGFIKLAYRKVKDKTCARIEFKND